MERKLTVKQQKQSTQVNRFTYILYLVLLAYLVLQGNLEWAITNMGVAMVFDPFDATVKWESRPRYQKAWLLVHLTLTCAGFIYLIVR